MTNPRPWMAWYPADILSDPKYIVLSRSAQLTYRVLLDRCWMSGALLPSDPRKLAALAGMPFAEFEIDWQQMQDPADPCFITHPVKPGFLTNKRILAEWAIAEAHAERAREHGKKGGRPPHINTGEKTQPVISGLQNGNPTPNPEKSSSPSPLTFTYLKHPPTPQAPEAQPAPKKRRPASPASLPDGFEKFWNWYPRKEGKANAIKAWLKINPDAALKEAILKALGVHTTRRAWNSDGGKYIPHPTTWLNQRRWEDQVTDIDPEAYTPEERERERAREVEYQAEQEERKRLAWEQYHAKVAAGEKILGPILFGERMPARAH